MKWPWKSDNLLEYRADDSFTNALITLLTARAGGQQAALPAALGALEAASGLVGRAFATAMVQSPAQSVLGALTPVLPCPGGPQFGEGRGDCLLRGHQHRNDRPAAMRNRGMLTAGRIPRTWEYRCNRWQGRNGRLPMTAYRPAGVLHFQWARDAATPWRGVGPSTERAAYGKAGG